MRRIYVGTNLLIKLVMKNLLSTVQLELKNVRIICKFKDSEGNEVSEEEAAKCYEQDTLRIQVAPKSEKTVYLKVMPKRTGELYIDRVEWELFDVAKCCHKLSPDGQRLGKKLSLTSDSLKFKVMDQSGEIESKLQLDRVDLMQDN